MNSNQRVMTLVENGQNLCGGSCSIEVTRDTREGTTIDRINGVVAE